MYSLEENLRFCSVVHCGAPTCKKGEKRPPSCCAAGFCIRRSFDGKAFYSSKLVSAQVRILMRMGQLHQTWIGLALLIFCLASPSFQSQDYNDEENPAVNTNDADVFGYYGPPSNYLENVRFFNTFLIFHHSFLNKTHLDFFWLVLTLVCLIFTHFVSLSITLTHFKAFQLRSKIDQKIDFNF